MQYNENGALKSKSSDYFADSKVGQTIVLPRFVVVVIAAAVIVVVVVRQIYLLCQLAQMSMLSHFVVIRVASTRPKKGIVK